ncbi:MAG: CotH kinase family protein [Bacteroidia bacterium]
MKHILKKNKRISFALTLFIISIFLIGALAFFLNFWLKDHKKDSPELVYSNKILSPQCTVNGGFYPDGFPVKLEAATPGTRIFYTLDGSEPSSASRSYIHPFVISAKSISSVNLSDIPTSPRWKRPLDDVYKGVVLRAIAVDDNNFKSAELIRTFFIDSKVNKRYSLPVIAITINEKDFFGYKRGIYVLGKSYGDKDNYIRKNIPLDLPWWEYPSNYLMRGDDAERPAHIEFYEPDGKLGFESNVGIRINGNATRGYAQKSLRICFREKYGEKEINYSLFPLNPVKKFNSFILRNSGNDWDKTMFRDAFMQTLMKNTHLDIQDYRPSVVFMNGEYWGIHNIRERFDENYIVNKYRISADSITILELGGAISYGQKGDEKEFKDLLNFVKKNDLSDDKNYQYVSSKIDVESFSDFLIANIYYCNSDWPNNNVKFWRYKSDKVNDSSSARDGRWRWMLYDTDWGFGYNALSSPDNNLLQKTKSTGSVGILFSSLIHNKNFSEQFIKRFQYHLNTTFYAASVIALIDKMQKELSPEMQEHIDRWRVIGSYNQWLSNVEVLRDFAIKRPEIQAKQLNDFFNLHGDKRVFIKK